MRRPIYQEHGKTYQAANCALLVQAPARGRVQLTALARGQYPGKKLDRRALPGVKTVGFWDAHCAQDWGLDWHHNEGIELTFLERGGIAYAVDNRRCRLRPDDLTVARPWQRHRVGDPNIGAGRLHWLILDVGVRRPHQPWQWPSWLVLTEKDLRELTDGLRKNERPVWRATPEIRHCFQRIAAAVETDRAGSNISRLAVLLNDLLVLVLEMFRQQQIKLDASLASTGRTVELFWADLRKNLDHLATAWTVESMARQCGLGVTHFIHYSKQLTNTTPILHLNQCRLEAAARMLKANPQRSVLEVTMACGFNSSQYFATLFRRQFGKTPRDYRQG
ncbi:MAG: AraC family transcriptional regulator [Verrucomicrobia bacterium]|nr:AraC family transcriptional regulator [Verrucomicrobiota bacterium]